MVDWNEAIDPLFESISNRYPELLRRTGGMPGASLDVLTRLYCAMAGVDSPARTAAPVRGRRAAAAAEATAERNCLRDNPLESVILDTFLPGRFRFWVWVHVFQLSESNNCGRFSYMSGNRPNHHDISFALAWACPDTVLPKASHDSIPTDNQRSQPTIRILTFQLDQKYPADQYIPSGMLQITAWPVSPFAHESMLFLTVSFLGSCIRSDTL